MRKFSALLVGLILLFAVHAQAQVCEGLNSANRFATCTDATAANINVGNATAGTLSVIRGGTGLASYTASGALVYSAGATTLGVLAAGTNGYFLQMMAGLPVWSQTLAAVNGGTGLNSFTAGGVFYGATTTTIANVGGTAGFLLQFNGTSAPTAVSPATLSSGATVLTGQTLPGTPTVGWMLYASANVTKAKAIATTCSTAVPVCSYQGVSGQCQTDGPMLMFFDSALTLAAGNQIYISDATAGQVTNVAPTTAGHCVVPVGILDTASGCPTGGCALNVVYQTGIVQQL